MACPSCGAETNERTVFCTQCGMAKRQLKWDGLGFGGVFSLFIFFVIIVGITTMMPSPEEREVPDSGLALSVSVGMGSFPGKWRIR